MSELIREKLQHDPRVAEAKRLLVAALTDCQRDIQDIRPADPTRKQSYEETLERFGQIRSSKLWYPYLGSGFGSGPFVELLDGSVKFDFISGIGPLFFGHSPAELIPTLVDAATSDMIMQGYLQQNEDTLELCELLIKISGLPHCYLSTTGAMANENALKIAFQKNFPARRVLAFEKCFAGRTLAMSQITDKALFREGLPPTLAVDYLPFYDHERPHESTSQAIHALKTYIHRYPKEHAVIIFELVQGEAGFYYGSKEFYESLMEIAKEHHIAVFADEIQSFGRTSQPFAFQHFGLQKSIDISAIGKMSQVCATLFSEAYAPRPGLISQTFTSSTSAIRSSRTILEKLLEGHFYGPEGRNLAIHRRFVRHLEQIENEYPHLLRGPYGLGCMIAFTPFNGDNHLVNRFVHALFEAGVIGFVAGSNPTRVRFLPPGGILRDEEIDRAMEIVKQTLITFKG